MRLSVWNIDHDILYCRPDPLPPVFGIHLILSGEIRCGVPGVWDLNIQAPRLCAVSGINETLSVQFLGRRTPLRIVGVDFASTEVTDTCPMSVERLAQQFRCPLSDRCPLLVHQSATPPLRSLAAQILTCPLRGPAREIYLSGKALELLALGIDCIAPTIEATQQIDGLSAEDIERVDHVTRILRQKIQSPPSLEELAREVGLNAKRLTEIFRHLFGMSIASYLQQCRFEQAFFLLAHTQLHISEVAYQIGYTPAHFSTAFKKRFGCHPTALRNPAG
jgi:AraC family transcriptional activator of pyochelin receptor